MKKRIVLGHKALGTTLPEQKSAVKRSAEVLADIVEEGYQLAVCHSNAPQVGMIHTAMNEFGKKHPDYTEAPMSVCSAMSQGYIGYDLQNALQTALLKRGIYKGACTVLTQVTVDPYDEAFYHPIKVIGRYMTAEEADAEERKETTASRSRVKASVVLWQLRNPRRSLRSRQSVLFWMQTRWSSQQAAAESLS